MLTWQNSGFSIDASVCVCLLDRDVPSYFKRAQTSPALLRPPAFALERLSLHARRDGGPERIHDTLPRLAFITDPAPIRKIFEALGEPLELPHTWAEFVQVHDERDAIQASPDDLPVIDIRSV